ILTAVYRTTMEGTLPLSLPAAMREPASETLTAAVEIARTLPKMESAVLLEEAHNAFTYAFEVTAAVSTFGSIVAAILAGALLRHVRRQN
ncbi:MAG: MFS transporter, partial [Hyphomicrobium sp.]